MGFIIKDNRLKGVPFKGAADSGGVIEPTGIVVHYTAGANKESDLEVLTAEDQRYVSSHVLIGRDGSITQMVDFNVAAYHAGRSSWDGQQNCNDFTIGIEISNFGPLIKRCGRYYAWPRNFGRPLDLNRNVFAGKHKNEECSYEYWEGFTCSAMHCVMRLCQSLIKTYPIKFIVGHDDIAPGRKIDPGPAFPLDFIRTNSGLK